MIPVAGPVRQGVGLLGSPCFEIPRSVSRDHQFDELSTRRRQRRRLRAKNRHNAATMGLHLLVRWLYVDRDRARRPPPAAGRRLVPLRGAPPAPVPRRHPAAAWRPGRRRADLGRVRTWLMLAFTVGYFVAGRPGGHRVPRAAAEVLLDLPAAFLAARAVLEGPVDRLHPDVQRHAVQGRHLAPARRAGRPPGLRRRLLDHRAEPGQRGQRMPRSPRGASCSAIPWRTAPSSPTTS